MNTGDAQPKLIGLLIVLALPLVWWLFQPGELQVPTEVTTPPIQTNRTAAAAAPHLAAGDTDPPPPEPSPKPDYDLANDEEALVAIAEAVFGQFGGTIRMVDCSEPPCIVRGIGFTYEEQSDDDEWLASQEIILLGETPSDAIPKLRMEEQLRLATPGFKAKVQHGYSERFNERTNRFAFMLLPEEYEEPSDLLASPHTYRMHDDGTLRPETVDDFINAHAEIHENAQQLSENSIQANPDEFSEDPELFAE